MKRKTACDITQKTRHKVYERDGACIICGSHSMLQAAHYIGRAQGGLGIEENLVILCAKCHADYDNGYKRKEYGEFIRAYLTNRYPGWDEEELRYNKWRYL